MANVVDKLTPFSVKHASIGRHADGRGLYLQVTPAGGRYWRMKYRHGGKENLLALGTVSDVTLAQARKACTTARDLLQKGLDPSQARKDRRDTQAISKRGTFGAVTAEWLAHKRKSWATETYRKAEYITDTYLLPSLKNHTIDKLSTKDAARVITKISETTPTLASKARQYLGGIVNYAIQQGLREDGKLLSLRGTVTTHDKGHIPALTTPDTIAPLLRAIDAYESVVTRGALTLAMLTAMRPGIVASARWAEIDLHKAEWHVPGERMKTRHAHIVPLPTQALAVLGDMLIFTAGREFVFPPLARQKTPHLHRDALSSALRRMGFQGTHATHGFRGMLRTVGRERLGIDSDVLEAQLAHAKKGDVQKAYDRTRFDDARREAMQLWADYLDTLKVGGNVVPLKRKAS